jgi:hypothetical protein
VVHAGEGQAIGVSVRRVMGAQVGSGGGGHVGRGGADLTRVRERGAGARDVFLVHERIALCLDALVMTHVLIMVIVSRVGLVFLLEGVTLTLGPDTWAVHIFPGVVLVPLGQVVNC